jgi:hypothetical protein
MSTRATLALNKVEVNFTLHSYACDPAAERIGLQAAEAIGVEPRRVLKTLMAEVDGQARLCHRPVGSCSQHEKARCRIPRQVGKDDASSRRGTADRLPYWRNQSLRTEETRSDCDRRSLIKQGKSRGCDFPNR